MTTGQLDPGQLPQWTLENNSAMIEYIRSITLKSLPNNLKVQNTFYIVFKCVLLVMGIVLLLKLVLSGRFWLVRIVHVQDSQKRKQKLICPNACEGLCLAACVFYTIDLFYRGFSVDYFWENEFSYQHGMAMLYSFRLFFLWLAGFIHVAATLLIWPLDPTKIKPFYWHLFLFGCPAIFLCAYLPFCIRSELDLIKANKLLVPLLRQLEQQDPQSMVTQETVNIVNNGFQYIVQLWSNSRHYATVALSFLLLIMIGTIASGTHIVLRAGRRYRQIKNAANQQTQNATTEEEATVATFHSRKGDIGGGDDTFMGGHDVIVGDKFTNASSGTQQLQPPSGGGGGVGGVGGGDLHTHTATSLSNSTSALTPMTTKDATNTSITNNQTSTKSMPRTKHVDWRKFSRKRLLFYFFGFQPLPLAVSKEDMALVRYGKPTLHSIQQVLKDFYYFSLAQFTCLLVIELSMVACAFLVITTILPDLHNPAKIANYTTSFARTTYIFFVIEIWVIVVLGSPLIVIMLWRQLYPIKVDFENDIYTRKEPVFKLSNKWKSFKKKDDINPSPAVEQQDWHISPWGPSNRLNAMTDNAPSIVSPKLSNKDSFKSKGGSGGANDVIIISGTGSFHDGSSTNADDEEDMDDDDQSWSASHKKGITSPKDLCGLAGSDLGVRRIVLEALDSTNKYPSLRDSPRFTSSVWQRAAAEAAAAQLHHHEREQSSSPTPGMGNTGQFLSRDRSIRRNSHINLSDSTKRQSPQKMAMLGRLGGSIRRVGTATTQEESFSMNENPSITINASNVSPSLPENAKFATPHGLVNSRPYE